MSNRKKPKSAKPRNKSGHSRLADHKKSGKTLVSPMNSLPTTPVPWLRDVFPSLVWQCAVLTSHGLERGSRIIGEVLDLLTPLLPADVTEEDSPAPPVLDGTLQAFDAVPEGRRAEALEALKADGLYEDAFPWLLVRALAKYSDVPGEWILDGWQGNEQIVPADAPETYLATVVADSWNGRAEIPTRVKMLYSREYVKAGRVQFGDQISFVSLLPKYPHALSEDERKMVEASMRAMFGAMWGFRHAAEGGNEPEPWAVSFWRQNWGLYGCVAPAPDSIGEPESMDEETESPWRAIQSDWQEELDAIAERFYAAHGKTDPDLYNPDRNEVLTGITSRHLRAVDAMIRYPGLWSAEHGAATVRSLVEGRIVQKWLLHKDDADLFTKFKNYGRGHLKLQVLHLREYRDNLKDPIDGLDQTIESMEELLNRDLMEEFQDISIEGNFAGTDVRKMAYAVGLVHDYRLVFAPMSANVHSEWIALEQFALVPCRNPLHRGHRIPERDMRITIGPEVVDLAMSILDGMVDDYCDGIASNHHAKP